MILILSNICFSDVIAPKKTDLDVLASFIRIRALCSLPPTVCIIIYIFPLFSPIFMNFVEFIEQKEKNIR